MDFPFTRDRYEHVLLERDGSVCLVQRTNLDTGSVHWEVAILHAERARNWPDGRQTPAHDAYPSPESWGDAGWTYTALTDARRRYRKTVLAGAERGGSRAQRDREATLGP